MRSAASLVEYPALYLAFMLSATRAGAFLLPLLISAYVAAEIYLLQHIPLVAAAQGLERLKQIAAWALIVAITIGLVLAN
ncbi:MAG TPA: hypothetical protein VGN52_24375 [Burkholderiales bacterium]|jgi:hypothetical protein